MVLLRNNHVNVYSLRHQQRSKEIVETEDLRRHGPAPSQLVECKDANSQQTAPHTACQSDTHNISHGSHALITARNDEEMVQLVKVI